MTTPQTTSRLICTECAASLTSEDGREYLAEQGEEVSLLLDSEPTEHTTVCQHCGTHLLPSEPFKTLVTVPLVRCGHCDGPHQSRGCAAVTKLRR